MKLHRRSLLLAAALAAAWPAQAQSARPKRLGWLSGFSRDAPATRPLIDIVVDALRAKGWTLGENYLIEFRFAEGDEDLLEERVEGFAEQLRRAADRGEGRFDPSRFRRPGRKVRA